MSRKGMGQLSFMIGEQVFRSGATLTISVLLARSASKEEYGIYTLLFPVIAIILGVQSGLSSTPYVTLVNSIEERRKPSFLGNIFLFHLIISIFILLVFMLFSFIQDEFDVFPLPTKIIIVFGFVVVSWLFREFMRQVLLSNLAVKQVFVYGFFVNGFTILSISLLYCFGKLSLETTYVTMIATSIIPSAMLFLIKIRGISFSRIMFSHDVKECIYIGKWLAGRALLRLVSGPTILCAQLVSKGNVEDVALYGVCMIPSSILSPLTQALSSFLIPKFSRAYINGKIEVHKLVSNCTILLIFMLIIFNVSVFFSCDTLMAILFDGKYQPSPWLLLIFTIQMSVLIYAIPVNSALIAMRETRSGFIGELIASIIVISAGILMVNFFGLWGFSFVLLGSRIANRGYQIYVYNRMVGG